MKELVLPQALREEMEHIYKEMEAAYDALAQKIGFTCQDCPDNCCDSYFQHHTYAEWVYLWLGLDELTAEKKEELQQRARQYIIECERAKQHGSRPQVMCPLNEKGRCIIYKYRLMVCRTHGVPAIITRPDGQKITFPGCFRCQDIVAQGSEPGSVDRTLMLQKLAMLENNLLQGKRHLYPKVKLSIAEMIIKGPPVLPI